MAASQPHQLTDTSAPQTTRREYGLLRQCADSVVYLALAVILFRGFAVEGYMISTGSMAPCLLGYHHRIVCPACSFAFSRGTQFDDDETILAAPGPHSDSDGAPPAPATICPNCGLEEIDAAGVPRNEGDQLLVHKHLYQVRSPRRWEVVVFRHPTDPGQAYVKRVAGLPQETLQVIDGDVYADGRLQRKPLAVQRSMRICVYDHDHAPADVQWQPRWRGDTDGRWSSFHGGFVHRRHDEPPSADTAKVDWLTYHHWIRRGGDHRTAVNLAGWPEDLPVQQPWDDSVTFDAARARLECVGVLSQDSARRLAALSSDPDWKSAIEDLTRRSHESPIVDLYGYNHPEAGDEPIPVHDLMIEAVVARKRGDGTWQMQMSDGWHTFTATFDFAAGQVSLCVDDNDDPLCSAPLPPDAFQDETTVEMSLFDRQVLVAIDGELPFAPLAYAAGTGPRLMSATPVRIGAADLDLHLPHLRLYRDVHYTPRHSLDREGATKLQSDEFYMLGDNSPVSLDSRVWETPAIPRKLLIGKPFLVHLPSRQTRLEVAGRVYHFRIPDFTRVRYIR